ncbi:histidine phosphatase family protein [Nakamurella flavida]|uniref:Histidine phosphatase family protein n=1 Tax=Nakamurella flavida TaxID=363630 RepID=A0A938YG23_9ACTN|nr:histidine phosphatase family protein [Nakamurella flavida]MBM9477020.1 histidine phosphatase family protein [Nakamurella flavida]MDP9779965.1 putative phosphoglycerate mutase [Nakamurella flavida]
MPPAYAGPASHRIVLIRHGQTVWSQTGQHTGRTDIDLTPRGEQEAGSIPGLLVGLRLAPATVLCSPRLRSQRTATLAGMRIDDTDEDLAEWDYGNYEGMTRSQIQEQDPDWTVFTQGAPGGESPEQVAARADRVLDRARDLLERGDVALVSHGHMSRVLTVRWVGLPITAGSLIAMDPAALTVLAVDRGAPIIDHANVVPLLPDEPA